LLELLESWIRTCKVRQMSEKTTAERRRIVGYLIAFAGVSGHESLDRLLVEDFLAVLGTAKRPWEITPHQRGKPIAPMRPVSVQSYYRVIRTFCNWLVEEEYIEASPMAKIKPPIARPDQVEPLTPQQIAQLVRGAKASEYPLRNIAIIYLILDTGLRVAEVCGLKQGDLNMDNWSLRVVGKGNKARTVYAGSRAAQKALSDYLRQSEREDADPLFQSEQGGAHLTTMGIYHIVQGCGRLGGVARCGPHMLRHTFAFNFIRGGGSEFTLQTMLGHTSLAMTRKYVNLAGADMSAQARAVGALDSVLRKK
jgi:site-specific recombinase XerD